jgi:hypothetical protein
VKAQRKAGFHGFAKELADHARRRPWLLAVPAAGLAGRRLIGAALEGGAASALAGLLVTLAVAASFAELWAAEGEGPDSGRWSKALILFLLPYPALLVLGWLSAETLQLYVERFPDAGGGLDAVLAADLALSKIASMSVTLLSALAFARWKRGRGTLESLAAGWRTLLANFLFVAAAGAATWLVQELVTVGFNFWHEAALGASAEAFGLARLAQDYLVVAVSLIGCVAAPLQAARSGRLVEP